MMSYNYTRVFDPGSVHRPDGDQGQEAGDQRQKPVYVYNEEIVLAVNVALVTGRPLLVRGASGTGKSSLARNVADVLSRRFYEQVITSRTQARDLLWEVDLLRRLNEAQRKDKSLSDDFRPYINPGVLWWAFDPGSAQRRGKEAGQIEVQDPWQGPASDRAVVLLDEIDKADPDVPNNLLVPLGSLQFQVEETGDRVKTSSDSAPLVIITTNEERALPAAFLRRCVELRLELPYAARMTQIGKEHFPGMENALIQKIIVLLEIPKASDAAAKPVISPAEFIDTLRACDELKLTADDPTTWDALASITVWKHGRKKSTTG